MREKERRNEEDVVHVTGRPHGLQNSSGRLVLSTSAVVKTNIVWVAAADKRGRIGRPTEDTLALQAGAGSSTDFDSNSLAEVALRHLELRRHHDLAGLAVDRVYRCQRRQDRCMACTGFRATKTHQHQHHVELDQHRRVGARSGRREGSGFRRSCSFLVRREVAAFRSRFRHRWMAGKHLRLGRHRGYFGWGSGGEIEIRRATQRHLSLQAWHHLAGQAVELQVRTAVDCTVGRT